MTLANLPVILVKILANLLVKLTKLGLWGPWGGCILAPPRVGVPMGLCRRGSQATLAACPPGGHQAIMRL